MNFQLGADVRRPDGGKLGELHRVVYDPETQQIVSLIVTHNMLDGREVIVPVGVVRTADDESVELATSEDQFDSFEDFATVRNVAPPLDEGDPVPDLIHHPVDVADIPSIGAASGIESIAYTPLVEEDIHVATGDQVLDKSTTIWATDGQVGHLTQIRVSDETSRIQSLIVERGFFFKHDTDVPFDDVKTVKSETIVLSVPRSDLRGDE